MWSCCSATKSVSYVVRVIHPGCCTARLLVTQRFHKVAYTWRNQSLALQAPKFRDLVGIPELIGLMGDSFHEKSQQADIQSLDTSLIIYYDKLNCLGTRNSWLTWQVCSPWRHIMCMGNKIIKRPLVNHGCRTRALNMAPVVHVVISVGMFQCIYFQKRDTTSGGLAFTLDWANASLVPGCCSDGATLLAAGSPPLPHVSKTSFSSFLHSLNVMKIKICESVTIMSWIFMPFPSSYIES